MEIGLKTSNEVALSTSQSHSLIKTWTTRSSSHEAFVYITHTDSFTRKSDDDEYGPHYSHSVPSTGRRGKNVKLDEDESTQVTETDKLQHSLCQ